MDQGRDQFYLLAESSPDAIFIGTQGRFAYANPAALKLFGAASAGQLLGQPVIDRIHPDDRAVVAERIRRLYEHRESAPLIEETYLRLDGTPLAVEVSAVPFRYDGEDGALVFVRDISQRKRTEGELRQNQSLLRAIVDNSTAVIFVKDLQGRYLMINRRYGELFHVDNETMRGRTDYDLFPAEVADAVCAADRQVLAAGVALEFEEAVPQDDGLHTYLALKFPLYDDTGQAYAVCGIATDITERRRAHERMLKLNLELEHRVSERTQELAESEARFRAFMAHSPAATWIVDGAGRFQYVNPVYCRMFSLGDADLFGNCRIDPTGHLIDDIYPAPFAQLHLRDNLVVIETGKTVEAVQSGLRADGEPGEFLVVKFPIRNADNVPLVCGIALDVTEQRRALAKVQAANQRLAGLAAERATHLRELAGELIRAEQRERDSLYELLHDHVQPLLVAARLTLSAQGPRTSAETWERVARETCGHIGAAIDTARSLSVELNPPLVRDRSLGEALAWLQRWVQTHHGLTVNLACDPDAEPADAAVRLLCFKAVRELLINVVKHAGTSRVEVKAMPRAHKMFSITVEDYGRGFDPATIGAAGSGLANIERRLGMIGGRLEIDSAVGAGAIVTLLAPRLAADAPVKENTAL